MLWKNGGSSTIRPKWMFFRKLWFQSSLMLRHSSTSPNQQWWPLSSLLSLFFSYGSNHDYRRRIRQNIRQRSSLLFGGRNWFNSLSHYSIIFHPDDLKKRINRKNGYLAEWMIIRFTPYQTTTQSKWMFFRNILFKSCLMLNGWCGIQVYVPQPTTMTFGFCLLFCLYSSSLDLTVLPNWRPGSSWYLGWSSGIFSISPRHGRDTAGQECHCL